MAHPLSIDPDDPHLDRLRALCLDLPGADEKLSHGRPNFFTKKVFAIFGGVLKGEHDPYPYGCSVLFLPFPEEHPALLEDARFFVPAYLGPSGWLGLDFRPAGGIDQVDWTEVAELVEDSYRQTAPRRLVAELDARR